MTPFLNSVFQLFVWGFRILALRKLKATTSGLLLGDEVGRKRCMSNKSEATEAIDALREHLKTCFGDYERTMQAYIHQLALELEEKSKLVDKLHDEQDALEVMAEKLAKRSEIEVIEHEITALEEKIDKLQHRRTKREEQKGNLLFDLEQDKKRL